MERTEILSPGNKLSSSYCEAVKAIELFLIQPVTFHACPIDCVLFRGEHTDRHTCPDCGESRYIKRGTPARRFTYLPIGPRLIWLFGTQNLAKIV